MSAAPRAEHQVPSAPGTPPAAGPAAPDAPVLSLVRPRRTHAEHPVHPHPTPGPHPPADHSGTTAAASDAASLAAASSAKAGPPPAVAADRGSATARGGPLTDEDRALLTSMAPALATALVEVLVGARSAQTVERWVEGSLFERIVEHTRIRSALAQGNPHADRPVAVSAARLCEVSESIVEISLVVRTTRRPRALALRLVRRRSRWRLSEFLSI